MPPKYPQAFPSPTVAPVGGDYSMSQEQLVQQLLLLELAQWLDDELGEIPGYSVSYLELDPCMPAGLMSWRTESIASSD